ncbi:hypothetical protein B0J14DRAFT_604293 [Halenospora varia]|nr:hypothetical protein B0J14DRAFT_604293 [Halenospora varia]
MSTFTIPSFTASLFFRSSLSFMLNQCHSYSHLCPFTFAIRSSNATHNPSPFPLPPHINPPSSLHHSFIFTIAKPDT